MILRVCALALLLSSCATVKPLGDHRELAEQLVKVTSEDSDKAAKIAMQTAMQPLVQSLKDQGYKTATIIEVNQAINEYINDFLTDPTLNPQIVDLYVGEFSPEELQQMLDFYQLPVGKKAMAKLPVIVQKSTDIGMILAQKYQGKFAKRLDEILVNSNCDKCKENTED